MMRLERTVGLVLRVGVTASSIALAAGLILSLLDAPGAKWLLHIGVLTLLTTPVARVLVSIAEYAAERDWIFVSLTAIVLVELLASAVAALVFNRRL
jgi:uncharacterized membrane protein